MRTRLLMLTPALLIAGCTMGPKYKRPQTKTPDTYRSAPAAETQVTTQASLAETKAGDLFDDPVLKQLIADALQHNFDLAIAGERVQQARAQFRITGADLYPFLYAGAGLTANRPSRIGSSNSVPSSSLDTTYTQVGAQLSWEIDLFGRLRRLRESARAQYFATEEDRHGVLVALIADVSSAYFTLRERDLELQIARRTRDIAQRNLDLVRLRHDRGAATGLAVHQAEQFLYTATGQIASAERDIGTSENALNLLVGKLPGDVARGKAIEEFRTPSDLPAGMPSSLLERRPDIRAAEQMLISANAQVGAAKAYYFPQISLTGFLGGQSRALTELFTGPARYWSVSPTALLPIFNAGQVRVAVKLSEARKREMLINYQRSIYNGFREVSDALISYDRTRAQRKEQDSLVRALEETNKLANLRYQGGLDSYLQVLDAERSLFQGQLVLAELRLQELNTYVQVYRALGGGWQ